MIIQKQAAPGNYSKGRTKRISRITFHHVVGSAQSAIAKFQTLGVEVSATYVVGADGQVYQCVADADTAFCDSNADSNARTISIEHAGPPYSEPMYQASIELVRNLITRYGITDFKRHRDVSETPTSCPGNLDVERIIKEAKESNVHDIFNEGDRVNVNNALFGADRGYWKDQIGRTYKQAREYIDTSPDLVREQYVNKGDIVNIANKTGWPPETPIEGWLWKRMWYDYASNKASSPEAILLKPGLYKVNLS